MSVDRGRTFTNVFAGTVYGDTVSGQSMNVPLGSQTGTADLTLTVRSNGLRLYGGTGSNSVLLDKLF
jgi:hypothetical protein